MATKTKSSKTPNVSKKTTVSDVFDYMFKNRKCTSDEIGEAFGLTPQQTAGYLAHLSHRGAIKADEPAKDKNGVSRWVLVVTQREAFKASETKAQSQRTRDGINAFKKAYYSEEKVDPNLEQQFLSIALEIGFTRASSLLEGTRQKVLGG